jgi:hypothetical protein
VIDKTVIGSTGEPWSYEIRIRQVGEHRFWATVWRAGAGYYSDSAYKRTREKAMAWAQKAVEEMLQRDRWDATEERIRL